MAAPKHYTEAQKVKVLATLAANGGNVSKTARETGVDRVTLRAWRASDLANSPEVSTTKKQLEDSFLAELEANRAAALRKVGELVQLANAPEHLRDVVGAFKTMNDSMAELETQREIARAIAAASAERAGEMN